MSNGPKRKPIAHAADGMPIFAYGKDGKTPVCNRKISGKDKYCQSTILNRKNGRCRAAGHGGYGNAGAPIRTGLRSKALVGLNLAAKFEQALSDPGLVGHRENVAMLEALITDNLEGAQPPAELWAECAELCKQIVEGNPGAIHLLLEKLKAGHANAERIDKAVELAEKQRRHKESEHKRETDLQTSMDVRQANAFVMALTSEVMEVFASLMESVPRGLTAKDLISARIRIAKNVAARLSG